jgi:hypothetical protein
MHEGQRSDIHPLPQLGRPQAVLMPIHAYLSQSLSYSPTILSFDDVGD